MNWRLKIIFSFTSFVIMLAWAPWLNQGYAEQKVRYEFVKVWSGVIDGCGFDCRGCGIINSTRRLFGYEVKIAYLCGMTFMNAQPDSKKVFVSAWGTIQGLPK